MKKIFLFLLFLVCITYILQAQDRAVARGAEPRELYLTTFWYGIYCPGGPPCYDTLRKAVFRIAENGQKVTIQYDFDYFADYYTPPGSVMQPLYILADATPGVLYALRKYSKNYYTHTQLWVSFDYGKNWVFREENIGAKGYFAANFEGLIYRTGIDGCFISENYGTHFNSLIIGTHGGEPGLKAKEAFGLYDSENQFTLIHTIDLLVTYTQKTIDPEYASSSMSGFFPDVYRGALEGEVYIHSWFPWYNYKVSFSADTGDTFRHVYVNENYPWQYSLFDKNQLLFMSDREPGVFYILNLLQEQDENPGGFHLKLCIHYYRDYGETLVDIYCHDVTKNYARETCEAVNDLTSEKPNNNSVLLTWTEPESDLPIEGYRVFRNHKLLTEQIITDTYYLDENLVNGDYEYNVLVYYSTGCISEISNFVSESVEGETCEPVNDLISEKPSNNSVLLTWTEPESSLTVEGYRVYRNEELQTEELQTNTYYYDNELSNGVYEYYVITFYENGCISDSSNHVRETIIVEESCEPVKDLVAEAINNNSILLAWSEPESNLQVNGYYVFRNSLLQNEELLSGTTYKDENLSNGNYEYYVVTHYTNGCVSDSSNHTIINIEVGINESGDVDIIVIYPNPTTGELFVQSSMFKVKSFEIFDIYGRKVLAPSLTVLLSYDLTVLQAGIYLIKIITEKGIVTQKIIKY